MGRSSSIMPNIKLTYFNGRGRGETARLILAYGGMHYEDRRVSFEDMPSLKPSLPFGQLPLLEVDGDTICQSMAIARYLASECGIAGSSGLVKAQVDEVVDVVNDVQNATYGAFFEKDEKVKAEKMKKVGEETIPNNLRRFWRREEASSLLGTVLPGLNFTSSSWSTWFPHRTPSAWRPLPSLRTSWREPGRFRTSRSGWRRDQPQSSRERKG